MCREYRGYDDPKGLGDAVNTTLKGSRPGTDDVPYIVKGKSAVRFLFPVESGAASGGARLRLHSADQSAAAAAELAVVVNGRKFAATLPKGLGIQDRDPAHLAFPATAVIDLPGRAFRAGENELDIRVSNNGWFTCDAMDLTAR